MFGCHITGDVRIKQFSILGDTGSEKKGKNLNRVNMISGRWGNWRLSSIVPYYMKGISWPWDRQNWQTRLEGKKEMSTVQMPENSSRTFSLWSIKVDNVV